MRELGIIGVVCNWLRVNPFRFCPLAEDNFGGWVLLAQIGANGAVKVSITFGCHAIAGRQVEIIGFVAHKPGGAGVGGYLIGEGGGAALEEGVGYLSIYLKFAQKIFTSFDLLQMKADVVA